MTANATDELPTNTETEDKVDEKPINLKEEAKQEEPEEVKPEIKYFHCMLCNLREKYEFFGKSIPWVKDYKLQEDAYVIEDPFLPPKRGEFLVLGAHCVKCKKSVCKDSNCSIYFAGTYCISCAKANRTQFPKPVQEKLNRIVLPNS